MLANSEDLTCEVALTRGEGNYVWASLQGKKVILTEGGKALCFAVLTDLTAAKLVSEEQIRSEALRESVAALEEEIARRRSVERKLRESKRRQSRMLAESKLMLAQLRSLSHQVLNAQEEERKRISRDLHDEIAQTLVAINFHLLSLAAEASVVKARMESKILETQALVEQSVKSVHRFAMALRPAGLDDLGLVAALRVCVRDFSEQNPITVQVNLPKEVEQVTDAVAVALYRIAQAALMNVARHAEASEVRLTLRQTQRSIILEIADNGKAFDVMGQYRGRKPKRLGMIGMRERAEMVGGRLVLTSNPGKGTVVSVRVPLAKSSPAEPSKETVKAHE